MINATKATEYEALIGLKELRVHLKMAHFNSIKKKMIKNTEYIAQNSSIPTKL